MQIKYKRVLIVNDDDTEEEFFKKYNNLKIYRNIVSYCNEPMKAFEYITSDNFGGFDKIILDIKIEWSIPDNYREKMNEYVDADAMSNANIGFLIFMYLILKGYPISRIAFLSAYIKERDEEYEEKKKILEMVKRWKKRDSKQDEQLRMDADKIPSIKKRIIRILKNDSYKGIKAYEEIKKILIQDIDSFGEIGVALEEDETNTNEQFFQLLSKTGFRVENKINKKDNEKLKEWIEKEKTDELKNYYRFRNMTLNICEYVKDKSPDIYSLYKSKEFKERYPKSYFQDLIEKVQDELFQFKEEKVVSRIAENVVSELVAFWESLDKKYINIQASEEDINNHALTMLLKNTRNWYAHGRIDGIETEFCRFIFLSSVRVIYGKGEAGIIEKYVKEELDLENVKDGAEEGFYRDMWKGINDKIIGTKKLTNTYTISVVDLYNKYSQDKTREEIQLTTCDLYKMFILCLHFPNVLISNFKEETFSVSFNRINYDDQEPYMIFLEKLAMKNLKISVK